MQEADAGPRRECCTQLPRKHPSDTFLEVVAKDDGVGPIVEGVPQSSREPPLDAAAHL